MFGRKRFKIEFKKDCLSWDVLTMSEVSDSCIIEVLENLQRKYDFEILKISLQHCYDLEKSFVVIRCQKDDRHSIYGGFCKALEGKIRLTAVT